MVRQNRKKTRDAELLFTLPQGKDERFDIGKFLSAEDIAHRWHGRDNEFFIAGSQDLAWLEETFPDVGRIMARGNTIQSRPNRAAFTL